MKVRFTKYATSFLFAFMGIYISISGHNTLFGFIGGIGIGLALKMAYEAGKENNKL